MNSKLPTKKEKPSLAARLTVVFLLVLGQFSFAQQSPQYSLYMFNTEALNPAYAGSDGYLHAVAQARQQWVGLSGSPVGIMLDVHFPLPYFNSGFGVRAENDVLGAQQHTKVQISYNYAVRMGENTQLRLGLRGGIGQHRLDGSKLRTPDGNYEGATFDHQDVLLPTTSVSASAADVGAGVYFQNKNIEIGLAADNLLPAEIKYPINGLKIKQANNYFLTFAYRLALGESFVLQPSALLKTDAVQFQADVSLLATYGGNIFCGGSLRGYNKNTFDAAVVLVGFGLNENWRFAYSYDIGISALKAVHTGSQEILLSYKLKANFGKGVLPPIIFNPRF